MHIFGFVEWHFSGIDLRDPPLAMRYWCLGSHHHTHNHSQHLQRARSKRKRFEADEIRTQDQTLLGGYSITLLPERAIAQQRVVYRGG